METTTKSKGTEHSGVFMSKHYFLATLPKKESEHTAFLEKLNCFLGDRIDRQDLIIFHHSAHLEKEKEEIRKIFQGAVVYSNGYLNLSANISRENDMLFFDPDCVFLNPFINDFYEVNARDRQKKFVLLVATDRHIAPEVLGLIPLGCGNHMPEIIQNIKDKWHNNPIPGDWHGSVLSIDFPKKHLGCVKIY